MPITNSVLLHNALQELLSADSERVRRITFDDDRLERLQSLFPNALGVCADCGEAFVLTRSIRHAAHTFYANTGYNSGGDCVCPHCAEDYFTCDRCNEVYHTDDGRDVDGILWCSHCCDNHAYYWESDDAYHVEAEETNTNGRLDYGTDVRDELGRFSIDFVDGQWRSQPLSNSDLLFGIEVEMESDRDGDDILNLIHNAIGARGKRFAIGKEDGSLGNNGLEIVSLPMTMRAMRQFVTGFDALKGKANSFHHTDGRCGVHVHISRNPLTRLEKQVIDAIVAAKDNQPLSEYIARRKANHYNRRHNKCKSELGEDCGEGHYGAVSISSGQPTLEIRIYKGTIASKGLLLYLDHVESVLAFASEVSEFYKGIEFADVVEYERVEDTENGLKVLPAVLDSREVPDGVTYLQWLKIQPAEKYPVLREHLKSFTGFASATSTNINDV